MTGRSSASCLETPCMCVCAFKTHSCLSREQRASGFIIQSIYPKIESHSIGSQSVHNNRRFILVHPNHLPHHPLNYLPTSVLQFSDCFLSTQPYLQLHIDDGVDGDGHGSAISTLTLCRRPWIILHSYATHFTYFFEIGLNGVWGMRSRGARQAAACVTSCMWSCWGTCCRRKPATSRRECRRGRAWEQDKKKRGGVASGQDRLRSGFRDGSEAREGIRTRKSQAQNYACVCKPDENLSGTTLKERKQGGSSCKTPFSRFY